MPDRRSALNRMAFGGALWALEAGRLGSAGVEAAPQDPAGDRETLARAVQGFSADLTPAYIGLPYDNR